MSRSNVLRRTKRGAPPGRGWHDWMGVAAAPAVWFTAFLLNMIVASFGCAWPLLALRYGSLLLAVLLTGTFSWLALRHLRASRRDGGELARFSATASAVAAVSSFVLVVGLLVSALALDACLREPLG